MSVHLRSDAKASLNRAQSLIGLGDDNSVRYACLELRFCIEFLLLDLLRHYRIYLDDDAMAKWTPKQILTELLNVDPYADKTATISVGAETTPGELAKHMHIMGEDRRLTLNWANRNYNALGNFLHAPTLLQVDERKAQPADVKKKRATEIAAHLDHILKARIWSVTGGATYELTCPECLTHTKRLKAGVEKAGGFVCRNPKCQAVFDVTEKQGPVVGFTLRYVEAACDCEQGTSIKAHLFGAGRKYACDACCTSWEIRNGLISYRLSGAGNTELSKD